MLSNTLDLIGEVTIRPPATLTSRRVLVSDDGMLVASFEYANGCVITLLCAGDGTHRKYLRCNRPMRFDANTRDVTVESARA